MGSSGKKFFCGKALSAFFLFILSIFYGVTPLLLCSCSARQEEPPVSSKKSSPGEQDREISSYAIYASYTPSNIEITPLTEISQGATSEIIVYVSLLDAYNSTIKSPGIFRFELYDFVPRSPQPKGRRLKLWPDMELLEANENNNHWEDYFRAYKFTLSGDIPNDKPCILQATFITPDRKRLTDDIILRPRG